MDSEHGQSASRRGPGSHDTPPSIPREFNEQNRIKTNPQRPKTAETPVGNQQFFVFFQCLGQIFAQRRKQGAPLRLDDGGREGGRQRLPQDRPLFLLHFGRGQMNLTDGRVTRTLDEQHDYAENNAIESRAGESLQEVGTAALLDNAAAAAHPRTPTTHTHTAKLHL